MQCNSVGANDHKTVRIKHKVQGQNSTAMSFKAEGTKKYIADTLAFYCQRPRTVVSAVDTDEKSGPIQPGGRRGILKNRNDPIFLLKQAKGLVVPEATDSVSGTYVENVIESEKGSKTHETDTLLGLLHQGSEFAKTSLPSRVLKASIKSLASLNDQSVWQPNPTSSNRDKANEVQDFQSKTVSQNSAESSLEESKRPSHSSLSSLLVPSTLESRPTNDAFIHNSSALSDLLSVDQENIDREHRSNSPCGFRRRKPFGMSKEQNRLDDVQKLHSSKDAKRATNSVRDIPTQEIFINHTSSLRSEASNVMEGGPNRSIQSTGEELRAIYSEEVSVNENSVLLWKAGESKAMWPAPSQIKSFSEADLQERISAFRRAEPKARRFIRECQQISTILQKVHYLSVCAKRLPLDYINMLDYSADTRASAVKFDSNTDHATYRHNQICEATTTKGILKKGKQKKDKELGEEFSFEPESAQVILRLMLAKSTKESVFCGKASSREFRTVLSFCVNQLILPSKFRILRCCVKQREIAIKFISAHALLTAASLQYEMTSGTRPTAEDLEAILGLIWEGHQRLEEFEHGFESMIHTMSEDFKSVKVSSHLIRESFLDLRPDCVLSHHYQAYEDELTSLKGTYDGVDMLIRTNATQLEVLRKELFLGLSQMKRIMGHL